METVVSVILPVFLLVFLGWILRRNNFPGDEFWSPAEKLTYFVLFPCLIATTLATAALGELPVVGMVVSIVVPILIVTALVYLVRPLLGLDGPKFSSVYQGSVRMNTYIGLSVALGIHGELGLMAAAIAVAAIVPLVNLTCVMTLLTQCEPKEKSKAHVGRRLITNPLIIACVVGILLNISGIASPPILGSASTILSRAALPLGLLAVGSALTIFGLRDGAAVAVVTSLLKLIVLPLLTWVCTRALQIEGVPAFVAVLFNGLPTAASSYILAKQLGGDAALMASLITWQTILSLITLPLLLAVLFPV